MPKSIATSPMCEECGRPVDASYGETVWASRAVASALWSGRVDPAAAREPALFHLACWFGQHEWREQAGRVRARA